MAAASRRPRVAGDPSARAPVADPRALRAFLGVVLLVAAVVLTVVALNLYREGSPGDPQYPVATDVGTSAPTDADAADNSPVGAIRPTLRSPGYVRTEYAFSDREIGYRDLTVRIVPDFAAAGLPDGPPARDGDVVALFWMRGGAHVEPQSVTVDKTDTHFTNFIPSYRATVQDAPDGQYIFVIAAPGAADGPFIDDFTLRARVQRPVSATENSRTVLVTPRIYPSSVCFPDALDRIPPNLQSKYGLRTAIEDCSNPDTRDPFEARQSRVNIVEPESFKVDYTNLPTRTPGLLSWSITNDLDSLIDFQATAYVVNYVRINQDVISARDLFTSAALIGVAAALAPIAFELLGTSRLQIARRIRRLLPGGAGTRTRAPRARSAEGRGRRLATSGPVRAPLPRRRRRRGPGR